MKIGTASAHMCATVLVLIHTEDTPQNTEKKWRR